MWTRDWTKRLRHLLAFQNHYAYIPNYLIYEPYWNLLVYLISYSWITSFIARNVSISIEQHWRDQISTQWPMLPLRRLLKIETRLILLNCSATAQFAASHFKNLVLYLVKILRAASVAPIFVRTNATVVFLVWSRML